MVVAVTSAEYCKMVTMVWIRESKVGDPYHACAYVISQHSRGGRYCFGVAALKHVGWYFGQVQISLFTLSKSILWGSLRPASLEAYYGGLVKCQD